MKPELSFKVEVAVHRQKRQRRGGGGWRRLGGVGLGNRKAQRHESIEYFSTKYSEAHEEFKADSSNERFILLTHSFSWTVFECKSWFSILDLVDFAP